MKKSSIVIVITLAILTSPLWVRCDKKLNPHPTNTPANVPASATPPKPN